MKVGRVVLGRVLCGASCLGASCLRGELSLIHTEQGRFDRIQVVHLLAQEHVTRQQSRLVTTNTVK